MTHIANVRIHYRPEYRCRGCHVTQVGCITVWNDGYLPEHKELPALPISMPEGWASYGVGKYACPDCKG